jgi:hypothetical protein
VYIAEPGSFEVGGCLGGDFRVDVDCADVAARPREGGEQRGVPPGSRSGLEDTVAVADVELLKHGGDRRGPASAVGILALGRAGAAHCHRAIFDRSI